MIRAADQPSEPLGGMMVRILGQEELGRAERDLRFPKLRCRDEVLKRENLTIEFLEYDASEETGWTRLG